MQKITKEDLANNKGMQYAIIGIAVLGVSVLAYFGIIRPLLQVTGVVDDKTDKEADKKYEEQSKNEAWNPNYFQTRNSQLTITSTSASLIAKYINNSLHDLFITTDSNAANVIANLEFIKSKADLSYVNWQYSKNHGLELLQDLKNELNSAEFVRAITIIEKIN